MRHREDDYTYFADCTIQDLPDEHIDTVSGLGELRAGEGYALKSAIESLKVEDSNCLCIDRFRYGSKGICCVPVASK